MNNSKDYLGSKYSQSLYPTGKVDTAEVDSNNIKERLKSIDNTKQFWKVFSNEINHNYSRPVSLKEKNKIVEQRYKTKILENYFKPKSRLRHKRNKTNLTPDELILIEELDSTRRKSIIKSSIGFYSITGLFCYYKRSYITKSYLFVTFVLGIPFSISLGYLLNVKSTIIALDMLGKEYETSRQAKQFIFNKRRDLSSEQKSEIYAIQNKNNEEITI